MNNRNAKLLLESLSRQVQSANEAGATHLKEIPVLDMVWLIGMANRDVARCEHPDGDNLQLLHEMVAQLCVKLGADPDAVPCDVWHLAVQIEQLTGDLKLLAHSWDKVGRDARAGWDDKFLDKADAARDRVLYPNQKQTEVQLPLRGPTK